MPLNAEIAEPAVPVSVEPPLCVDLDGTLVKSDTLLDGLCQFARRQPLQIWRVPLWLAGGRARLKLEVARRAPLDATRLPYNGDLLRYLQTKRREGRKILLATGADGGLAQRVAAHLGIFDGVLASDSNTNLTRNKKLDRLKSQFGAFDYVGNSNADVALLANARVAMLANPTIGLRTALRFRDVRIARQFVDQRHPLGTVLKAIRIHQWAKNILLFVPMLLSHQVTSKSIGAVFAAFFCFSFMASANYLLNDMLDIESDRRHPSKRLRPFAAGDLPVAGGMLLVIGLVVASIGILPRLPAGFAMWLGLYIAGTMAYSLYLKQLPIVDVLLLSSLYTLRLLAGGAATDDGDISMARWFLYISLPVAGDGEAIQRTRKSAREGRKGHTRERLHGDRHGADPQFRDLERDGGCRRFHALHCTPRCHGSLSPLYAFVAGGPSSYLLALSCLAGGFAWGTRR